MTRSAYWITRSSRCSAIRTVSPRSWTSRVIAASISSAAVGSSADVGSSSTSTRGWAVRTEPIATRCCWPPESSRSGRSRSSARPSRSSVSSTRLRITSWRQRELLHPVGELLLDGVGDESRERVLEHDADHIGQLARRMCRGAPAGDRDRPRERATGEVRNEAVDRPEQRRLARAGAADDEAQLALRDAELTSARTGADCAGIGDGDLLELDHATSSVRVAGSAGGSAAVARRPGADRRRCGECRRRGDQDRDRRQRAAAAGSAADRRSGRPPRRCSRR